MGTKLEELGIKLHGKLDSGIEQLKATQSNLESIQKDTESAIHSKLDAAKGKLEEKKEEAVAAKGRVEEYLEVKKTETKSSIAEWKAERNLKKLEKYAERAEKHAVSSIALALYYAGAAEVAILESLAARKNFDDAI